MVAASAHHVLLTGFSIHLLYADPFITILAGFQVNCKTVIFRGTCFVKSQAASTPNYLGKINISSF